MRFWKNNRVDQEVNVHPETILDAYLLSEQFKNWQEGCNFDRGFSIFLTEKYGTYEKEDFKKLGDYVYKNWEARLKGKAILNLMPSMTEKQAERQKEQYRNNGKYAKVNPCYVCNKSAGVDYFSHPDTDKTINDQLLCLCKKCYDRLGHLSGKEAIKLAFGEE